MPAFSMVSKRVPLPFTAPEMVTSLPSTIPGLLKGLADSTSKKMSPADLAGVVLVLYLSAEVYFLP